MSTQIQKTQVLIPDLPRNQPLVEKDGSMNIYWQLFFQNLIMALQTNLKPEGFVIPSQTATDIASLTDAMKSNANILYDSTNKKFKGNIDGTWMTFTLT